MSLLLFQLIDLLLMRSKLDAKSKHAADLCFTRLQQFWYNYAPSITIVHLLGGVSHILQVSSERIHTSYLSFLVRHQSFQACKRYAKKVRKFATKIASRKNSVNQYFGMQIHMFIFQLLQQGCCFVWRTWCFVWPTWCFGWRTWYLVFCLAYIIYLLA